MALNLLPLLLSFIHSYTHSFSLFLSVFSFLSIVFRSGTTEAIYTRVHFKDTFRPFNGRRRITSPWITVHRFFTVFIHTNYGKISCKPGARFNPLARETFLQDVSTVLPPILCGQARNSIEGKIEWLDGVLGSLMPPFPPETRPFGSVQPRRTMHPLPSFRVARKLEQFRQRNSVSKILRELWFESTFLDCFDPRIWNWTN